MGFIWWTSVSTFLLFTKVYEVNSLPCFQTRDQYIYLASTVQSRFRETVRGWSWRRPERCCQWGFLDEPWSATYPGTISTDGQRGDTRGLTVFYFHRRWAGHREETNHPLSDLIVRIYTNSGRINVCVGHWYGPWHHDMSGPFWKINNPEFLLFYPSAAEFVVMPKTNTILDKCGCYTLVVIRESFWPCSKLVSIFTVRRFSGVL